MRSERLCIALTALAAAAGQAAAQALPPAAVPGKEYIAEPNINALGFITPGQVLMWDGLGAVADGVFLGMPGMGHLDAIANVGDAFFNELRNDQADMVLSFRFSPAGGGGVDVHAPPVPSPLASLWYSESTPNGSGRGVWAYQPQVDVLNAPENVIGVELWGPSNDSNFWSFMGDPGGTSVWTNVGGGPAPYLSSAEIATAIIGTPGLHVDLDALMVQDQGIIGRWDHGDAIIFSIMPSGPFDGGEIWVMDNIGGVGVASFLVHGGIVWDTAHFVQGTFGYIEPTENIDALEAILPSPGTLGLIGLAGVLASRRRRA